MDIDGREEAIEREASRFAKQFIDAGLRGDALASPPQMPYEQMNAQERGLSLAYLALRSEGIAVRQKRTAQETFGGVMHLIGILLVRLVAGVAGLLVVGTLVGSVIGLIALRTVDGLKQGAVSGAAVGLCVAVLAVIVVVGRWYEALEQFGRAARDDARFRARGRR